MEIVPGVLRLLVVDLPEVVMTPTRAQLEERSPLGPLLDAGWRNLHAMLDDPTLVAHPVTISEGAPPAFQAIMGESVYTASLVLMLPELLARLLPSTPLGPAGALVGFAFRNQLAVHVIGDRDGNIAALTHLPRFVARGFADAPGPISPHTYWWHDGRLDELTTLTDEGSLQVHVDDPLARLLGLVEED